MSVLDPDALARLVALIGDDPADLVDLMESFLQDATSLIAALDPDRDLTEVARAAHSLNSNARDFGATELAALCKRLERDLKTGNPVADLPARLAEIRAAWPGVKAAIEQELAMAGGAA